MMTFEEKCKAVEAVLALRPKASANQREKNNPDTLKRMSDLQFQRELMAIMNDEPVNTSAFFFRNSEPSKGGQKNDTFNPYRGLAKK
ncbi:hypothetical protein [Vibrio cholerae]|uniref:hypothetical protein n=1 Tax=Vibrio cholerae TaxID=666 RepID=UPI0006E63EAB|nr:hypothetical protein [Vibrio cholerae]EGR2081278.1 hypothetical protein [Vibrio cholerae]EGR4433884.1 hypothetical protein [Vibrio cholerae]KQA52608.1 hypothetical protein XV78_12775 [Vibrio cholerae]KQA62067.1 hypothetical protein XV81_13655 [Vibrio cholerae]KQA97183.1 hypothetical protein XV90_01120 [Vibrio cholerae]